jgi:Flp pilus assembly protein TadG
MTPPTAETTVTAKPTRRLHDDAGMTTVQLAIIFPAVLLWLLLIVQYGLWWHARQVADAAAAEAVAAARIPTGTDVAGEQAALTYLAESGHLSNITVTVDIAAATVTATVTGDAPQLVPGFGWGVTASSHAALEQFVSVEGR